MKPELSILLVTFNRLDDVKRCIESLLPQVTDRMEVLVIDNGSSDGTPEYIQQKAPEFKLEKWVTNKGLAPALRKLADGARGDWLMFLDSDTVLPADAISTLLTFGRSMPSLGAVAPRMKDLDGNIQMTARRFPSAINGIFGRQTLLSRLWPGNPVTRRFLQADFKDSKLPFRCDWVAFAAVLVRRRALEEAGSIDPEYFVYWVDADFFKRLSLHNWEVWCLPQVEVLHLEHNRTSRRRSPVAIRDFHMGALRYFYKFHGWHGFNPLLWVAAAGLFSRMFLHLGLNFLKK